MGDVFDAMNRARQEHGGQEPRRGEAPPASRDDAAPQPEGPSLPLDDVPAELPATKSTGKLTAAPALDRAVSAAADRAAQLAEADPEEDIDRADAGVSLNGYSNEIVTHHDRGSIITEQYRAIRTQILARARNRQLKTTVVTSAAPGEGKSVTTINLGVTFSELRNKKILLVEGDLRRPTFAHLFRREAQPGLLQLLRGESDDLDKALHPTVYDNLQFLPAGGRDSATSTELLSSPRMAQILDRLKDRYDFIFLDTPPIINVTDASILGAVCDQTILVVRLNKTPEDVVERAKRLLRAANCELAGVVLTHLANPSPRYLYRYGYY